jgi:adenosylcobinamide-GDP ribazoletransferase
VSAIAEDRRTIFASIGDCVSLLSVLPIRKRELSRERAGRAIVWAPLVGAGLAVLAGVFMAFMRFGFDPGKLSFAQKIVNTVHGHVLDSSNPIVGITAIAVMALLTRGLHLDGLADTVDALASYRGPDKALEIMRKPDLGPLGMAAVVLTLMAQVAALNHCVELHRGTESLIIAAMLARLVMVLSCTPATPAARAEGLGALVAGTVSRRAAFTVGGVTGVVCVLVGFFDYHSLGRTPEAIHATIAVVLSCAVAHVLRAHCVRRLGGMTGDVLGFLGEIAFTISLVVMAFGM